MTRRIFAAFAALTLLALFVTAAPAGDITGKWKFVLQTDGGEREIPSDLKQDGQNLTGKWGKADVKGTVTDGKLEMAFPIETEEAGNGTIKLIGKVDGEALTGNWDFNGYTGTFKATRLAE